MTRVNLKAAVLQLAQTGAAISATDVAARLDVPRIQAVRAIRKLRIEGRLEPKGEGLYEYIQGSVSPSYVIHDPTKAERARRFAAARRAERAQPTLPLVQWAQINSPASVWAYAARSET